MRKTSCIAALLTLLLLISVIPAINSAIFPTAEAAATSYTPGNYALQGSTAHTAGSLINVTSNDQTYMSFTSYNTTPTQHLIEVEFNGTSNTAPTWSQLNWTVDSAWTVGSVNVTIQLYNQTLNDYPISGDGYENYISSSTPDTDQTIIQTVTPNATDFRDSSGNWKMRIQGAATTEFELRVDWVEFEVAYNMPPIFEPIGDKSVIADEELEFTVNATDPDGDSLTYSAINIPDGATFNITTHNFTWTPNETQIGIYEDVCFKVYDGELTDSENITITVTPNNGAITVIKEVKGEVPAADWEYGGDLGNFTLPADGGNMTFTDLPVGDYNITETPKDGYYVVSTTDNGDSGTNTISVEVDPGEHVNVTFINTAQNGTVTVVKEVVGDPPSTNWTYTIMGPGGYLNSFELLPGGSPPNWTSGEVEAGTYNITEALKAGYNVTSSVSPGGETGTNYIEFDLLPGEDITVTFTNTDQNGTITIIKVTDPTPDLTDTTFNFTTEGGLSPSEFTLKDGENRTFTDLPPGQYNVTEFPAPEYWNLTIEGADAMEGNRAIINLEAGENVTVIFTNENQNGTIIVRKIVVGETPGSDWSYSGDLGIFSLPAGGGNQTFNNLPSGSYTITETTKLGYDASSSADTGETGTGSITVELEPGETVTVTFTNTVQPTLDGLLNVTGNYIQSLLDGVFKNSPDGRRGALQNKLQAVESQIENGAINGAKNKLLNDLRKKMDGATDENQNKDDWIIDEDAQNELRSIIDLILGALGNKSNNPESDGDNDGDDNASSSYKNSGLGKGGNGNGKDNGKGNNKGK